MALHLGAFIQKKEEKNEKFLIAVDEFENDEVYWTGTDSFHIEQIFFHFKNRKISMGVNELRKKWILR